MDRRRQRRTFKPEYKAEVVRLVRTSGKSIGQLAKELDLTETAVRTCEAGGDLREARSARTADERGARGKHAAAARAEADDDGAGLPPKAAAFFARSGK